MRTVVVMGVSGSGKCTVGAALAADLGVRFVEADDFHSPHALAGMGGGHPLSDVERRPWLARVMAEVRSASVHDSENELVVLACSALSDAMREVLLDGLDEVRFLWLHGEPALLAGRLALRRGHPVGVSLLPSQLATLEPPLDAVVVDITVDVPAIVSQVLRQLSSWIPPR